jgi:hypothetical protein
MPFSPGFFFQTAWRLVLFINDWKAYLICKFLKSFSPIKTWPEAIENFTSTSVIVRTHG